MRHPSRKFPPQPSNWTDAGQRLGASTISETGNDHHLGPFDAGALAEIDWQLETGYYEADSYDYGDCSTKLPWLRDSNYVFGGQSPPYPGKTPLSLCSHDAPSTSEPALTGQASPALSNRGIFQGLTRRTTNGLCSRDAVFPDCESPAQLTQGAEDTCAYLRVGSGDAISPSTVISTPESESSPSSAGTIATLNGLLLKCCLCQGVFEGSGNLLVHLTQIHPDRASLCGNPTCAPIKRERDLLRHLDTSLVHTNRQYLCPCGYARGRKDEFRRHFVRDLGGCRGHYKCKCGLMRLTRAAFDTHFASCGTGRRGRPKKRRHHDSGQEI
ncbi:zinc finger protein PLAG1 [Microdochium nivale]|nr:zinc finger protein PLAG1 [Microdochium nivale]